MELPILCFAWLPLAANLSILLVSQENKEQIFKTWSAILFYVLYILLLCFFGIFLSFFILLVIGLCGFDYNSEGYYPSVGYGFMNLYLLLFCLVNSIYMASFGYFVFVYRTHFVLSKSA